MGEPLMGMNPMPSYPLSVDQMDISAAQRDFIDEVDSWLSRTGTRDRNLGMAVCNDPALVHNLRGGRKINIDLQARIRSTMADNPAGLRRPRASFTDENDELLTRLWNAGLHPEAIARIMGLQSTVVSRRANRLRLQPRVRSSLIRDIDLVRAPMVGDLTPVPKMPTVMAISKPGDVKERPCLGPCGKMFTSTWAGNRRCGQCLALENQFGVTDDYSVSF